MALINVLVFAVLKILYNLIFMQKFLFANNWEVFKVKFSLFWLFFQEQLMFLRKSV